MTEGNCEISAETCASTPKLIKTPRIRPQENHKYERALLIESGLPFELFKRDISLCSLSMRTNVPR